MKKPILKIFKNRVVWQSLVMMSFVVLMLVASALPAFAVNAPEAGTFMYDAYDIVVNSLLKGAFGFVVGIFIFVTGIAMFFRQMIVPGVICVVCTALIIKSDAIITSLGVLI